MFSVVVLQILWLCIVRLACHARLCKNLPGDDGWPSLETWDTFNKTIDGRLVRTVPIGTPCHSPNFNADECAAVQGGWHDAALHDKSSSSVMFSDWANKSCDPFSGPDSQCVIGTYVQYAVNVSTPSHVIRTVDFAKKHSIRFVVRNTGHDLMGKSTGTGALAVWMHHLKDTDWMDEYKSGGYNGPAVKVAAGVQVLELYAQADAHGYAVVGGGCPTVGFAGGYIQGGGHSPLSGAHGLAADQTLEFEAVTTTGQFITASPVHNSDLYWALSGGGGGSYAIVWSVTVKAFIDTQVTVASVSVLASNNVSLDTWWSAVEFYQASIPRYTTAGTYATSVIAQGVFSLAPAYMPNKSHEEVTDIFQPFLNYLANNLSIPFTSNINTYPGFLPAYSAEQPSSFSTVGGAHLTSRLLPNSLWDTTAGFDDMMTVMRNIVDDGLAVVNVATAPTIAVSGHPKNSVLPVWREAQSLLIVSIGSADNATLEEIADQGRTVTDVYGTRLHQLAPTSGAYLNEADAFDPDWKNAFYGLNYATLLGIKDEWDPDQILFSSTAVGGDRWTINDSGALCRVGVLLD